MLSKFEESTDYPLLRALLRAKGLELRGIYTVRDAAAVFGVSRRSIQQWCRDGKLLSRSLPGRGRFLSDDLEEFLKGSTRKPRELRRRGE